MLGVMLDLLDLALAFALALILAPGLANGNPSLSIVFILCGVVVL